MPRLPGFLRRLKELRFRRDKRITDAEDTTVRVDLSHAELEPPTVAIELEEEHRGMAENLRERALAKGLRIERRAKDVQIVRADGRTLTIFSKTKPGFAVRLSANVKEEDTIRGKEPTLLLTLNKKTAPLFLTKVNPTVFVSEPFGDVNVVAANYPARAVSRFQGYFVIKYGIGETKPKIYFYNFGKSDCEEIER